MQIHLKSVGYTDTVLFPTIGNAENVQSPGIGKPDIYCRKGLGKSAAKFGNFWSPG
jgi:hypothetical protein